MGPKTKRRVFVHLAQFFTLGLVMGISEDLLAIHFATEATITWEVFKIAAFIAIPFAIINEVLVDLRVFRRFFNHSKKKRKR